MKKRWLVFTVLLIVALTAFLYIRFFFVFGEGVKSGELNYVVYKGLVFKTYEGKLGGKNIELHYKEYFGALPWRGFSKFVVDSIVTKPIGSLPIDSETER